MIELTAFSNALIAYLSIILAVIFLIVGLIFKHSWLFWLSAICWLITGFYCFTVQDEEYVRIFGFFCFLLTLVSAIIPTFIGRKIQPTPIEEDNFTRLGKRIESVRSSTEKFKAKGKDIIL